MLGLTLDLNPSGLSFILRDKLYSAVSRYLTRLDAALTQYYSIPEYTFTDGSVITGKFYATQSSSNALLGSTESDAAHRPYLYLSGGAIALRIPDAIGVDKYIIANSPALEMLKINTFRIWRSGGTVSLQLNSNTPVSSTPANGWDDVFFTTIGSKNGGNFFNGYIWDVECSTSTVPERFYALDEDGTGIVAINRAGDASVNSLLDPTDLTTAEWLTLNCTVTDSGLFDPDGNTAYLLDCTPGATAYVRQSVSYANVPLYTRFRVKGTAGETIKVEVRASNSSAVSQVQHVLSGDWEYLDNSTSSIDWDLQTDSTVLAGVRHDAVNTADQVLISYGQLRPEYNGTRVNLAEATLFTDEGGYYSPVNAMSLVFDTTLGDASNTISLPLAGSVAAYIDWGDGATEYFSTAGNKAHTYDAAGTYEVRVGGSLTAYGSATPDHPEKIIACNSFGDIGITSLSSAFRGAINLLTAPNSIPSSVTDMAHMFRDASSFNADLSSWDTSSVVFMNYMFNGASVFNVDLSSWDTSSVVYMNYMFRDASAFNVDLSSWDTSSVTNMGNMFNGASIFNADLSSWCVSLIPTLPAGFGTSSALDPLNYPVWGTCPA